MTTEGTLIVTADEYAKTRPVQAHRTDAHHRPSPTAIPEDLIEYFNGMQYSVRWGSRDELQQGMDVTLGWVAVLAEDLPEDMQKVARRWALIFQPDGTITRGDMILQSRSFAYRDEQAAIEQEKREALEDPGKYATDVEDAAAAQGIHIDPNRSFAHPVSSATGYSADVIEAVQAAVEERKAREAAGSTPLEDDLAEIANQSAGADTTSKATKPPKGKK